jgi:hypothetical protein
MDYLDLVNKPRRKVGGDEETIEEFIKKFKKHVGGRQIPSIKVNPIVEIKEPSNFDKINSLIKKHKSN